LRLDTDIKCIKISNEMEILNFKENNSVFKEIKASIQSNKSLPHLLLTLWKSRVFTRDKEHKKSEKNTSTGS